jgi:uncharacterized protein YjbJ (UPF0337 family)
MADENPELTDSPATWENVVVGKAKEVAGHVLGDEELAEEGEEQAEIAHEVRDEVDEDRRP